MPCTKAHIDANPSLKEDHIRGVLAGEFPVNYEAFNDEVASGIIRKLSNPYHDLCLCDSALFSHILYYIYLIQGICIRRSAVPKRILVIYALRAVRLVAVCAYSIPFIFNLFLGPVPKLFSSEPLKSLEELQKSPQFAFECLQALAARLLERGELTR